MKKRVLVIAALVSAHWLFQAAQPTLTPVNAKRANPALARVLVPW